MKSQQNWWVLPISEWNFAKLAKSTQEWNDDRMGVKRDPKTTPNGWKGLTHPSLKLNGTKNEWSQEEEFEWNDGEKNKLQGGGNREPFANYTESKLDGFVK